MRAVPRSDAALRLADGRDIFSFQRLADENVSGSAASNSIDLDSLHSYCRTVRFEPDEALRLTGRHYRDMYLITAGEVEVRRDIGRGFAIGPGSPIGEIGFLRSCPATATVIAKTAVDALVVDDATLARLEGERPVLAAQLLQVLANIAEERTSPNLT